MCVCMYVYVCVCAAHRLLSRLIFIKLTLHVAEVARPADTGMLMAMFPDRIGMFDGVAHTPHTHTHSLSLSLSLSLSFSLFLSLSLFFSLSLFLSLSLLNQFQGTAHVLTTMHRTAIQSQWRRVVFFTH